MARRESKIARVALARRLLTLAFYALRDEGGCRAYPVRPRRSIRPRTSLPVHQLVGTDQRPVTREILEATRVIIEDRVRATGVADPVVRIQGADRIGPAARGGGPACEHRPGWLPRPPAVVCRGRVDRAQSVAPEWWDARRKTVSHEASLNVVACAPVWSPR